jgi:hypothetical protein|tara:strand:- start:194 stop:655 length:462 start_codon:yes stop_codon:yes gene_type:complete
MATTTATITLASSDIADNSISISNTATLSKAGSTSGLDKTSGLRRRTLAATTSVDLIQLDHFQETGEVITENKAAKVYIKNIGTSTAEHVKVCIGQEDADADTEEIGRLYGGDWMFFPWAAVWTSADHNNNEDIYVIPSSTDSVTLEWMVIYE